MCLLPWGRFLARISFIHCLASIWGREYICKLLGISSNDAFFSILKLYLYARCGVLLLGSLQNVGPREWGGRELINSLYGELQFGGFMPEATTISLVTVTVKSGVGLLSSEANIRHKCWSELSLTSDNCTGPQIGGFLPVLAYSITHCLATWLVTYSSICARTSSPLIL